MRRYHLLASYLPALALIGVLLATPRLAGFAASNLAVQAGLVTVVAAIPARRTGRMSYVDIAWPWGLVAIGVQVPVHTRSFGPAAAAVTLAYLAIGLRMGLPGVLYLARFGRLRTELARYRYQRIRWAEAGWRSERVPMALEIYLQGLANASVLAVPALLLAADQKGRLSPVAFAALAAWAICWSLEWLADRQKRRFAARAGRKATCDAGLWRYSRHPNYFFQWMGWNALSLAATPSLVALAPAIGAARSTALAVGLVAAPAFMLWTLLHLTGIKPAEHYSVLKRPGYADYQRTTNAFVPGLRRHAEQAAAASEARP